MTSRIGGAMVGTRPSVAAGPPGGRRRRRGMGGDPLGRHRTSPGVGVRRCCRRSGSGRPGRPAVARGVAATVVTAWAAVSALGLYLGVPETDHVVGVAAVLIVLLVASLGARRRASWVLVVGLDVAMAWAAVRGAPAGGPALAAGLAMPGLLVVAPLTSYLPGRRRAASSPSRFSLPRWSVCRPASPSSSPALRRAANTVESRRPSRWRR